MNLCGSYIARHFAVFFSGLISCLDSRKGLRMQDDMGNEFVNPKLGNVTFSNVMRTDGIIFGVLSGPKGYGFRCGDVTSIGMIWVRIHEPELAQEVEDLPYGVRQTKMRQWAGMTGGPGKRRAREVACS